MSYRGKVLLQLVLLLVFLLVCLWALLAWTIAEVL